MSDAQKPWHEILGLNPTNIENFYTRPGPLKKFDPLLAEQEELERYGFPFRPDPAKDKKAHNVWRSLYGRATTYVVPELRKFRRGVRGPAMESPVGSGTSPNWAGNVCRPPAGQTFKQINGLWTVPPVNLPFTGPYVGAGSFSSSVWIGLDGFGSPDVFQAGTEQDIYGPISSYSVWTEWFPADPVTVGSMPALPGDLITMQLAILPFPFPFPIPIGQVFISNFTRGFFTTVVMLGPSTFVGNSAEWIVETPCISSCGTTKAVLTALPYFGPVSFWFGVARDTGGNEVFGGNGLALSMDNTGMGYGRTGGTTTVPSIQAEEVADPLIFGVYSVPL